MTDIALIRQTDGSYSIDFENGDFKLVEGFDTLITLILFSDARAPANRVPNPEHRRGWIGDLASRVQGRTFGSLLWLLDQKRLTQDTLNESINFAQIALNILVQDGICSAVAVDGEIVPRSGIRLTILITSNIGVTTTHYVELWEITGSDN